MLKDFFVLAYRNLRKKGLRSWLTMLGIFISIATIFILLSLSLGLKGAVDEQFKLLGTDKFFIQPSTGFLAPPGSIPTVILSEKDVDFVAKQRGIKDYSYFVAGNARIEFGGETKYFMVWGIPPDRQEVFFEMGNFNAEEGSLLEKGDRNKIVVGTLHQTGNIWKRQANVGSKFEINGEDFKVKGILERIGNPDDDQMVMMDIDSFKELFDTGDRVDYIMVQIDEGEDIKEVADRVKEKLMKFRGEDEDTKEFSILTPEELLASFGNILTILTAFLGGIAAISLLVGGIGIANTMYTSVIERTKEIGTMKAVGAQNKDILFIFLIESGLLGIVGAAIGILIGMGVGKIVEWYAVNILNTDLLQAAFPWWLIVGCLVFGFLIGAVSGTFPAMQASKTNVVDALRYE